MVQRAEDGKFLGQREKGLAAVSEWFDKGKDMDFDFV